MLRRSHLRLVAIAVALSGCGVFSAEPGANTDAETVALPLILDAAEADDPEAAFAALIAEHPRSPMAHRGHQDALRGSMDGDAFTARYREAAEAAGEDSLAWYLYGRAVISQEQEARRALDRAVELDPTNAWAVAGLVYLSYAKGDVFAAVQRYEDGVAKAPRSALMRRLLGNQYLELKLYVHAHRHLEIAHRLAPDDLEIRAALGKALLAMQDEEGARALLEGVRVEEPRLVHVAPSLAAIHLRRGCPVEADELYREALSRGLAPDDELASEIRSGLVLRDLGRDDCAYAERGPRARTR